MVTLGFAKEPVVRGATMVALEADGERAGKPAERETRRASLFVEVDERATRTFGLATKANHDSSVQTCTLLSAIGPLGRESLKRWSDRSR